MVNRSEFWLNKKVLITGHTGFKGSWLALILNKLGAEVVGIGLTPDSEPSLYQEARISEIMSDEALVDIRNFDETSNFIAKHNPHYLFHLAAQPLVNKSFTNPRETFETNIQGTVNVLISALNSRELLGCIIVTTDKVYENKRWEWPYRESDRLGGHDPYSASKAAAEIVVSAIRESLNDKKIPISTVRAGNVIGGGDWSIDRIIPDLVYGISKNTNVLLRNPRATRPWQHVLDCLSGYLLAMENQTIFTQKNIYNQYNFGPDEVMNVGDLSKIFLDYYGSSIKIEFTNSKYQEEQNLALDSNRARQTLGWRPLYNTNVAIEKTAEWYRDVMNGHDARGRTLSQIDEYFRHD